MDQTVVSTLNSRLAHTFVAALALALMSTAIATVPVAAAPGDAPVTGSFFVDTSRDGALDPGEAVADTDPLFPPNGVSVTAYDGEGNSVVGAVTPGTPPTYSIDPSSLDGQGYRLEFELNPADVTAGWAFTVHGPDSASSTQFVDAGDIADIGVVPPSSCRGGDGSLMFSCFALDGLVDTLVTSDYDTGNKVNNALEGDTGSVWGVAYDEWTDRLFTSAVIRNPFDLGSQGPAGLYIQTAGGAWSGFDLGAVFLNGYDPSTASVEDAASATARIGIGDIDLSDDGRTLFVSNIATSSIHVYDVSTGVPVQQTVVPVGDPGCAAGDSHRIWATKSLSSTSLLVGAVCTAEVTNNAANLTGHILEVSTAGTVTPVPGLSPIPLNYQRGCATQGAGCSGVFEPWTDSSAYIRSEAIGPFFGAEWNNVQQPMISDIEVSESGDILVGISDRTAYQHLQGTMWDDSSTPGVNEGDLGPMAMGSGGDLLFMENTGTVAAPSYVLDPAISVGGGSEYFSWDVSQYNIHREITSGAAWVHPAKNEVVATVMDPIVVNTMGLITSNLDSASKVNAYEVGGNARVYKAGGLGDIEGCFKPIEIGDRVWLDLDNDGVQDPDELALAGVTVTITGPGLPAGGVTAVTNADGIWTFDSIDGLLPSTAYTVTVDVSTNTTALPPGFTNADLFETVANSTAPGGNGENDSNVSGGTMTVTTPAAGSNDHSFDAGYSLPFDQALEKTLTSFDIDTRTAVFEIEVTNQGAPIETFSVTDYLGAPTAGMWEDFNGTANPAGTTGGDQALPYTWDGSVAQAPVVSVSGGLGTGESVTIPITLRWTDPLPTGAAINNWAEISNFDDDNNPSNGDASSGDLTDADSTPDGDQTNDAQPAAAGDPTDGVIDNTAGDEDDHDVAGVQWWDLTLIKERSASQPYVVDYTTTPPTISFDITVANQGTETATAIGVTDYLPAGTVYTTGTAPAMPAGVTDNGDGTFDIATLDPGDAVTFSIVLDITDLSAPLFTNGAEIDSFLDVNGNPQPDIDSTPDAVNSDPIISNPADLDDPTNSHNDIDYDPDADGNLSEPTPGDEDDHDIETVVPPFDQALQKTLDAFQPSLADGVQVGDLVTYTLTVTNQGAPIQLVEVIDYLPTGLSYSSANQSTAPLTDSGDGDSFAIAWDGTDPIATLTGDSFDPLETLVIPLVLEVDASWSGLDLVNWAEISNFDDDQNPANGDAASGDLVDSDSTPDATDGNDPAPAAPNAPGDNTITGNGDGTDPVTGDEDDHDVAGLPVWDLSLIKERSASQPYVVDYTTTPPTISFDITVVNQGSEVATAIGVTDYLPAGTVYTTGTAPAMPAGVTDNGDGTFDIATLDPGDTVTFTLILDVVDYTQTVFVNGAEIDSFLDVNGTPQPDSDSTPDATNTDPISTDPANVDNPDNSHNDPWFDPDGDGNHNEATPGDEDDHDIEVVVAPYDLALAKTIDLNQPALADGVQQGDIIVWDLTITNQAAPVQTIDITDYPPAGLTFAQADQAAAPVTDSGNAESFTVTWDAANPVVTLAGDSLDFGESVTVPIALEVGPAWDGSAIINWAEISNFDDDQSAANGDASSGAITDVDSTPDDTQANDAQPTGPNAPGDNTITGNGDGTDPATGDEDDHDVAGIPLWDLSLIKERSAGQPYVVDYTVSPPTISYDITVMNQGSEVATAIGITDYLPTGTAYTAGTAPTMQAGVTDNGDGTFDIATLNPGDTVTFSLILDVTDLGQLEFVNGAEIDSFLDVNGNPQPDSDSTPDATNTDPISTDAANADNPANSHNDIAYDPDGDGNLNEATPGDEDDHDIEVVVAPLDLALAKTIDLTQASLADGVQQGDIIVWDLTITNQAAPVQTIDITDYPPAGFTYAQADQAAAPVTDSGNAESFTVTWDAANPVVTLAGDSLDFGESVTVPIALEVGPAWDGSAIINWAEISNFDTDQNPANGDAASGDLADIDSTPDDTQANDTQPTGPNAPGDNEITGNGDGTDPVTGDEDDHDVAGIPFWDLSLIKERSAGQPYVVDYTVSPPTISYDITVTNQGSEVATAIGVTDYLPTGTAYTAGTAPTMPATTDGGAAVVITDNGDGTFAIDTLDPGDMVTFTMILDVTDLTQDEFVNGAEIDSFLDVNGNPQPDSDSTPDAINDDDVLDDPTNADNPANSHNDPAYDHDGDGNVNEATPGDEDDHDVEVVVPPYDLALSKVVDTAATVFPLAPGDPVTFTITVTNQGRSVTDFDVTDYIDTTLWDAFDPAVNPAATTTGDVALPFTWLATDPANPVAKVTGQLLPTQSISIPVTLTIRADYSASNGSALENWAEISSFDDDGNPATPGPTDVDSTPDGTQSDDAQPAGPGEPGDDVITGNGDGTDPVTGDEDDHDVAGVEIFDLALLKTLNPATTLPVVHGAPVTFDITVINQGSVHATNISVIDYVDLAMWDAFDASINPAGTTTGDQALAYAWTAAGTDGSVALTGSLAPGGSVTIPVTLTIQPTADLQTLINTAEVSAADAVDATGVTVTNPDGSPLTDIDSVPDTTNSDPQPQNPGDPTDNVVDNSDGDEDDHDIASVVPPTYSLGNQVWFDADNNGLVDPGEAPASGVVVELWEDTDGDGQPDALVGTMTTDTSGLYLFDGLEPGDYVVVLPESNFADGGPLENWWSSTPTSTDPNDGVDQDDNGIDQTSPTGDYFVQSGAVAVGPFSPTSEAGPDNDPTTPDNHENLTVDFGFTQFSLGNQVWADENNDGVLDPTEDPISGVLVHLFTDADGDGEADDTNGDGVIDATDALATDTTDADGGYLFTGLPTGDYIVGIAPENWASGGALENMLSSDPTETDPNTDVDDDDNGVPCNCPDAYVFSGPTTLAGGEPTNEPGLGNDSATFDGNSNLTVDFGFHQPTFDLALKKTLLDGTNTATVNVGDVVTFTITVYNQGNVTAENIEVVDYLPSGLELSDGDWTLDTNGNARTTLAGPIAPGASVDVDLTARVLPSGELGNIAEIAGATPLNPDGTTMVLPSGALFPDADSVADDSNSETPVDDEINNASGDEDDHDGATLVLAATTSTPLAFTGSDSRTLALQALMLIVLGGSLAVFGSRRRREI